MTGPEIFTTRAFSESGSWGNKKSPEGESILSGDACSQPGGPPSRGALGTLIHKGMLQNLQVLLIRLARLSQESTSVLKGAKYCGSQWAPISQNTLHIPLGFHVGGMAQTYTMAFNLQMANMVGTARLPALCVSSLPSSRQ